MKLAKWEYLYPTPPQTGKCYQVDIAPSHLKLVYQNTLDSLLCSINIQKPAEVLVELKPQVSVYYGEGTVPGTGDIKTSSSRSGGERRV